MKRLMTKTKENIGKVVKAAGIRLDNVRTKAKAISAYISLSILTAPVYVHAAPDADAAWNTVMEFLLTWVPRLGGVLLFVGAVEFAIAYKNEDANGKTNATRLMISGAMVIAIPVALRSLLIS